MIDPKMIDLIQQQTQLIQEADACLGRIQHDLKSVTDGVNQPQEDQSETDTIRTLQLVLQFRLDTQDALQRLFQFSQSLWQILGLSSQHSGRTNMERMAFALGHDDLHYALSMLNRLIDSLLRLLKRYDFNSASLRQTTSSHRARALMKPPKPIPRLMQKMVRITDQSRSFVFLLNQLTNGLVALEGQPVIGPVLDHIARLEGPISHFYQALQNGLVLSAGLYQQLEARCQLNKKLDELLHQAQVVLEDAPHLLEQPRLFHPTKDISSSQELEARAAEKRLGHFFRPAPF